jgi:hypothetical protein
VLVVEGTNISMTIDEKIIINSLTRLSNNEIIIIILDDNFKKEKTYVLVQYPGICQRVKGGYESDPKQ